MNYDQYKKLSKSKKEEYNYLFGKEPEFQLLPFSLIMISIFLLQSLLIFLASSLYPSVQFSNLKINIVEIITTTSDISHALIYVILVFLIIQTYRITKYTIQKTKWKSENIVKL